MSRLIELVEFNRQLLDFRRAGWQFPAGLFRPGERADVAVQRINDTIADRALTGATLEQVLDTDQDSLTPAYRGLVRVGLNLGDLNHALECLLVNASTSHRLRNRLLVSLVYPLFLIVLALTLLVFTTVRFLPAVSVFFRELELQPIGLTEVPAWMREHRSVIEWMALVTGIVGVILIAFLLRAVHVRGLSDVIAQGLPGGSSLRRWQHFASFARTSAWLMEKRFPTDVAYRCAADLNGLANLAADFETSDPKAERLTSLTADAPLLHWVLTSHREPNELVTLLHETSDAYELLVQRRWQQWIRYVPLTLVVGIGGALTLAYVLSVMGALVQLVQRLT